MASLLGETVTLTVNYSVFADTQVNVDVYTGTFVVGAGVELSGQAISVTFTSGGFPQTLTGTISADIGANTMSMNFTGTQQAGGLSFILSSVADQSAGSISAVTETAASGFTNGVNQPLVPSFSNTTNGSVTAGFFPFGFQPGVNLNQTVSFTLNNPVAPTLANLSGDAAAYTQGGAAVKIDTGTAFSLTDPDAPSALSGNISMSGAVVTITDFVAGDLLSFTTSGGITGTFVNGVLTLSGLASRFDYRAVIRSITYSSTSGDATVGGTDLVRNISTTVTDASGLTSTPSLSTVSITGLANTPPAINFNTGLTLSEAGSVTVTSTNLDFNDAEQADTAITYTITAAATNGTLFKNGVALVLGGTFTQADINNGLITFTHDGSETTGALFQFTVSDGVGGVVAGQSFNFSITPVNDAPAFTGDLLATVNEGGIVGITLADLSENDPDDAGVGLVYTITATVNGQMELTSDPGVAISSFTQADLTSGLVVFVHNGSETLTGSFSFSLADGGENGVSPALGTVNFNVNPVNEAPTLAGNFLVSANEGGTAAIAVTNLNGIDPDDSGAGLVYSVTATSNGQVELSSGPNVAVLTFTQADLDNGLVVFRHDGSESVLGSFSVSLADGGENGALPATGTVLIAINPVNDAPVLSGLLTANVAEGGTVAITAAILTEDDPDDSGSDLTYTVTSTSNGQVELTSNPGAAVTTFTQADLDSGSVVYVHDGSETLTGNFSVSLADGGENGVSPAIGTVNFNVTPVNEAPTLAGDLTASADEGGIVAITTADLTGIDPDDSGAGLAYTITAISNGQVELTTAPNVAVLTFTQADLESGLLLFRHDGSEGNPGVFSVSLADGGEDGTAAATGAFTVDVNLLNDSPILSGSLTTSVVEGATTLITTATLTEVDPDDSGLGLTYSVTATSNGQVELASSPNTPITTFTQADLDNGLIVFRHNGSEASTGSFSVSAADGGENGSVPATATINLTVSPVDDPTNAADDSFATDEATIIGAGLSVFNANPTTADIDADTPLVTHVNGSAALVGVQVTLASGALLTLNANGTFSYDPNGAFEQLAASGSGATNTSTIDSFTYSVVGGDTATVTINIAGLDSNDVLLGTVGVDNFIGGVADDRYFVNLALDTVTEVVGGGTDRVFTSTSYTLAAGQEIETLSTTLASGLSLINLTGNEFGNSIRGNAAANTLTGAAGNDVFDGGLGADNMNGGTGDDQFYVDNILDAVLEAVGQGNDRIFSSVSYTLAAGQEVEILSTKNVTGLDPINLTGNSFGQFLQGNAGANILNGGGGIDSMAGLSGNDGYFVDIAGDIVTEAVGGGASDRVFASVSYALGAGQEIEILTSTNTAGAGSISLSGNTFAQIIHGNEGTNFLNGGFGNDKLSGFGGADTFVFNTTLNALNNVDTITDFNVAADTIRLENGIFAQLAATGTLALNLFKNINLGVQDGDDVILYNDTTGALIYDSNGLGLGGQTQFATLTGSPTVTNLDFVVI
jgi:VCBS repeat-containing protein